MKLSDDLLDNIDGGDECRGRDSQLSRWADKAERLERDRAELLAALRELFDWAVAQPFREHDGHPVNKARAAIAKAEAE